MDRVADCGLSAIKPGQRTTRSRNSSVVTEFPVEASEILERDTKVVVRRYRLGRVKISGYIVLRTFDWFLYFQRGQTWAL